MDQNEAFARNRKEDANGDGVGVEDGSEIVTGIWNQSSSRGTKHVRFELGGSRGTHGGYAGSGSNSGAVNGICDMNDTGGITYTPFPLGALGHSQQDSCEDGNGNGGGNRGGSSQNISRGIGAIVRTQMQDLDPDQDTGTRSDSQSSTQHGGYCQNMNTNHTSPFQAQTHAQTHAQNPYTQISSQHHHQHRSNAHRSSNERSQHMTVTGNYISPVQAQAQAQLQLQITHQAQPQSQDPRTNTQFSENNLSNTLQTGIPDEREILIQQQMHLYKQTGNLMATMFQAKIQKAREKREADRRIEQNMRAHIWRGRMGANLWMREGEGSGGGGLNTDMGVQHKRHYS
ncbi:hypothetical protein SBOR_1159 [Sclerotinia borealis F-4128]|uniref:Uncharacterized protein n=1 Tax=Sclerotinia borealis (strain F-4128) TaxID=1432307 RepID=W9CNW1_SCLBF|nr:hypothetical protein SBOR_1159 [Sclerotinia borealis F-4128]